MSFFKPAFSVHDSSGSKIATVANKKSALIMARAVLGSVRKGDKVIYQARNPRKKKKTKAKGNSAASSARRAGTTSKKRISKLNPGAKLKAQIKQMKPKTWYSTTLSGAKVKVQRKGQNLIVKPATKR